MHAPRPKPDCTARAKFRKSKSMADGRTRIDEIVDGIYRISTWQAPYGITFNQFLIADERPALVHTGMHQLYEPVRKAIGQVLDPAKLSSILLLHWEGDENGGMECFMQAHTTDATHSSGWWDSARFSLPPQLSQPTRADLASRCQTSVGLLSPRSAQVCNPSRRSAPG